MIRTLLRGVTALLALPLAYVLAGFLGAVWPGGHAAINGAPTERIALARGPIHHDILLPLDDETRAAFAFAGAAGLPLDHPQAEWLVVGWGAAGFYTTVGAYADITAPVLWRAVTGDSAVMRLDLAGDVAGVDGLQWVDLSRAQIAALRAAIVQDLVRDGAGQPVPAETAVWGNSHRFFGAQGRFNAVNTCNQWAGRMLRAAGLPLGVWTPTPQALTLSLWWHGA